MLDMCERVRREVPSIDIQYAWYNTGLEYKATIDHLSYLEDRYDVVIRRVRADITIPVCQKKFGQPFGSKFISEQIERLQRHGFQWEDDPVEVLIARYPNCRSSLRWWKNDFSSDPSRPSKFNIGRKKLLKEFILAHPPEFSVSPKCCTYAKKYTAKHALAGFDLNLIGVRKSEGGVRALSHTCYLAASGQSRVATYRPLFWFSNSDRSTYDKIFGIKHSDCYELWGFKRTGCVGCPFNKDVFSDLSKAERFEPKLVRAARKVFADSYEYTRMFSEFKASCKKRDAYEQMKLDI